MLHLYPLRWKNPLLLFLLVIISLTTSHAQSKIKAEANKHYQEALTKARQKKYAEAIEAGEKAARIRKSLDISILLGDLYFQTGEHLKAVYSYKRVLHLDPNKLFVNYKLGLSYMHIGKYKLASRAFEQFLQYNTNRAKAAEISDLLTTCEFGQKAVEKPVPYKPESVGLPNSPYPEYNANISADDAFMIYTRMTKGKDGRMNEDFYISYSDKEDKWSVGQPLKGINSPENEGAHTISADGRLMYITACNRDNGYGRCDMYESTFINEEEGWSIPTPLPYPINTEHWDGHPSVSSDGKTLYFSSDRPEGKGKHDLWYSTIQTDGKWSEPQNMETINTKYDEKSPFIHLDNQSLYFSSNRPQGLGGYDLFLSKVNNENTWSSPENLGYPINDFGQQYSIFISRDGVSAYIAAENETSASNLDILKFLMPIEKKSTRMIYMKGRVVNDQGQVLRNAEVSMYEYDTHKQINAFSLGGGRFFATLNPDKLYGLQAYSPSYMIHSERLDFDLEPITSDGVEKVIVLDRIERNKKLVLRNILFKTNDFVLEKTSLPELNNLVNLLNVDSAIKIRITGHTDNVGSKKFNQQLSEKRAKSVYDYLLQKSIDADRLEYEGLGSQSPIESNDTEVGRRQNRRTEITIL